MPPRGVPPMMRRAAPRVLRVLALAALAAATWRPPVEAAEPSDPLRARAEAIRGSWSAALPDARSSIPLADLEFEAGPARFSLRNGRLYPVTPAREGAGGFEREAGGFRKDAPRVFVFLGAGSIAVVPPDEIEAGQLELFTGSRTLDTAFTEAIFVVLDETLAARMRSGTAATPASDIASIPPPDGARARRLYTQWQKGGLRRSWGIEGKLLRAAWGDRGVSGYLAAFLGGAETGPFHFILDPENPEAAYLGSFVPPEQLEREARRRAGPPDVTRGPSPPGSAGTGLFDTWMSSRVPGSAGRLLRASRYRLDATIGPGGRTLRATERLELVPDGPGARAVELLFDPGIRLRRVTDGAGRELPVATDEGRLVILLAEEARPPVTAVVELDFSRTIARPVRVRSPAELPPIAWYPRLTLHDAAETEATFHWPREVTLLAGGRLVDRGEDDNGLLRETRRLEPPFDLAGFEVGVFELVREQVGAVSVTIALDEVTRVLPEEDRQRIVKTVRGALEFFPEVFGPYPFDDLAVVTVAEPRSAGRPGLVTLSVAGLASPSAWFLKGELDPSLLIAHEIAHQWWGNLIGSASYRDAWLSEGMAHYAALLYGRRRPGGSGPMPMPTANWRAELAALTEDGRTVESLGPVVLGRRLDSSLSRRGFETIVYLKGAVVLDMLGRVFGEDRFARILGEVSRDLAGRQISTPEFFAAIERRSGEELGWFVRQYVEGTGIPDVAYAWSSRPAASGPPGRWLVEGTMTLLMPPSWTYRIARLAAGWDVRRLPGKPAQPAAAWNLAVPFVIRARTRWAPGGGETRGQSPQDEEEAPDGGETPDGGEAPAVAPPGGEAAAAPGEESAVAEAEIQGRIVMRDLSQPFVLEVAEEPQDLWLDRKGEILARFFSEARSPKLALQEKAALLAAGGRPGEAADAWRRSLEARPAGGGEPDRTTSERLARQDAIAHLGLARICLDAGDFACAGRELEIARAHTDRLSLYAAREDLLVLGARYDLLRGEPRAAWSALRRGLTGRGVPGPEGQALLALAARALGHEADFERALAIARKRGVDVSALSPS